jgi:anthrone oxygenase-like protein
MLTGQLALLTAAVFADAAVYVSAVEQPAGLGLDQRSLLIRWKPAYKRGTVMQAPLAIAGFVLGLAAWWQTGHGAWAVGALLMIANWPVTFFAIMPTNDRFMAIKPATAGPDSRAMIERWGTLHMARTALGFAASLAFFWASLA